MKNPAVTIACLLIKGYQTMISPLLPRCCRFYPSCSNYALQAFKTRGFFCGGFLTARRILRCNPFSKGGIDPVPQKENKNG